MSRREDWNERYAAKALVWSAGPNELFKELVTDLPPGTALDVGCGEGRNAIWLAAQGWAVTAIDFSEVGISKGQRIAENRGVTVDWQVADVTAVALRKGSFDLVAVLYLHTDPAERGLWLRNVLGALRSGGTFIYIGHDPSNIEQGVGGPQRPELLPGVDELSAALSGLCIECAEVRRRTVASDPGHGGPVAGDALDTCVRAVKR